MNPHKSLLVALLFIAINASAQLPTFDSLIIGSFKQGGAVNCASVSVIKLAIAHYGIAHVFKTVDTSINKFTIKLRNDSIVELTKDELAIMANYNKFVPLNDAKTYLAAQFIYAVMAKNKYQLNPLKYNSIESAATHKNWLGKIHYLLAADTEDNFIYLGLNNQFKKINIDEAGNYSQIIITNSKHSAYSTKGYYDEFGKPVLNSVFPSNHGHRAMNDDFNYILIN